MSDIGSHVAVRRSDGRPPAPADEDRIRSAARSLRFASKDRIGHYEGFDLRFGSVRYIDGSEAVPVGLSAYFNGDDVGNDGPDPEVIIAREGFVAEQFAEDLAKSLGSDHGAEASSGHR